MGQTAWGHRGLICICGSHSISTSPGGTCHHHSADWNRITWTTGVRGGSGSRAPAAGPATFLRLRPCPLPDPLPTTLFPLLSLPVGRGVCGVAVRLGFGVTQARSESGAALPLTPRTTPAPGQLITSGSSPAGGGIRAPCVCADPFWVASRELKELPSSLTDKQTFHLSSASQDGLDLESGACVGGWVTPMVGGGGGLPHRPSRPGKPGDPVPQSPPPAQSPGEQP